MPAKLSKEVNDRFRSCLFVLSALRLHGPRVAAMLLNLVRTDLPEGGEEPGFLAPLVAFRYKLRAAVARLVAADAKLLAASAREAVLRRQRDETIHDLRQRMIGLRRIIAGQYVAPDLDGLGLQRFRHRAPTTVLRRAEAIAKALQSAGADEMLGKARFEGGIEARSHAQRLASAGAEGEKTLEQTNEAKRHVDEARAEKHEAMAAYDETFLRTARVFEDLCRYAGERELADKVRPSSKHPGRTAEKPEDVPDDALDLEGLPSPGGEPANEGAPALPTGLE